jgi:hypothetical protein
MAMVGEGEVDEWLPHHFFYLWMENFVKEEVVVEQAVLEKEVVVEVEHVVLETDEEVVEVEQVVFEKEVVVEVEVEQTVFEIEVVGVEQAVFEEVSKMVCLDTLTLHCPLYLINVVEIMRLQCY